MSSSSRSIKHNSSLKIIWRLLVLFKPYWGWMALGILVSFITLISNVGLLALSGWFIAAMAIAGVAGVDMNYFTPSASIRGLAIARIVSRYGERVITHEATFRLLAQLRRWFYEKLEPLSPAVLQTYKSGDLLSRIRADIDTLENFYLRILSPLIVAAIGTLVFVLFLHQYNPLLALVEFLLLFVAGVLLPILVNRLSKEPGERSIETASELRSNVVDSIQGMGELLIYGAHSKQTEKLMQITDVLLEDQKSMAKYSGLSLAGLGLSANLAMWFMLIIAAPMVLAGTLSQPNLAMLALFALASFETVMPLPLAFQLLPETLAAARRVFSIADAKPLVTDPVTPSPKPQNYDINFDHASFRYSNAAPLVLEDFSLEIPQGQKVGVIGPSGIGKSSIVNILLRFWPIESGQVSFGGFPIDDYAGDDIRQTISAVSQQTHLFNATLRANLKLANREASDSQIEQACKTAHIHDFIVSLPDGYDTWIGEAGTKLSGGQAQRVAIARALLKDTPVLILDEPFEGLDAQLERDLIDDLLQQHQHQTILYITHKKSGLDKMDRIIEL